MKKLSLILSALLLISTMIACTSKPSQPADTTVAAEAPTNTETVLPPEDNASNKAYPSVADLVQVPDTPVTHPPIEPADYGTQPSEGLEYKLTGNYYTVVGMGTCTDAKLVIPAEYEGKPVKVIGDNAFAIYDEEKQGYVAFDKITSVVISEGIEIIGERAFSLCTNLRNVRLPNTLKAWGKTSFGWCSSLVEVTIPEGIKEIPASAFLECSSLQKVTLPTTVRTIGDSAFQGCESLYEINLPEGLETIGSSAFRQCFSLKNMYLPSTVKQIGSGGLRSDGDLIWGGFMSEKIPEGLSKGDIKPEGWIHNLYYQGTLEQYLALVGSKIGGTANSTEIARYTVNLYINGDLVDFLTIPEGVVIPDGAFANCQSLKGIILPETCFTSYDELNAVIGYDAFRDCPNLEWIVIQGELPQDSLLKSETGNWLNTIAPVKTHIGKNSRAMAYTIATVATRRLYVCSTESEAAPFLGRFLFQCNEDEESYKYPNVEVFYEGEWHYDENGHPTPNTD